MSSSDSSAKSNSKPEKSFSDLPETDDHLREHRISSEEVYSGKFLHLKKDIVKLPDGNSTYREYLIHPGAVAIMPILNDGRILLERQFRYPVDAAMIEIPAGKLEIGEDPLLCAQRELLEETGYSAKSWEFLGRIHPVISYATETIDIYLAKDLTLGERSLDDGEFLDVFAATLNEMHAWIASGKITDVKTIISVYHLARRLKEI
ncbi:NUDIX hydrolase [Polynucleobacter sp. MWH-CaK5]|jgi:ADP-ribose pyrophosphatase|uniref:NUDIX domain-containing protein n=1 Tax=Polynucleobacter sp. MWH-CaK5 TaxID=2689107 RepID=UPI001BFE8DC9|nr:NUDIX hydrolase [Polynucleobacter sp. MWH-CaK5]QWD88501.1 NUDIX hydrolase [Polynucleobacter sp. MWH-CaK5]